MGARYSVSRTAAALSTTNDLMTITAPATRALKIWEIRLYGQGTTSVANEVAIARSTGGATPVAITPTPLATLSPAAGFTAASSWTTQPTLGVVIRRIGVNQNGAISPIIALPGNEIDVPPSGQVSIRSLVGTGTVACEMVVEEVG
jgi:hypothetical protein